VSATKARVGRRAASAFDTDLDVILEAAAPSAEPSATALRGPNLDRERAITELLPTAVTQDVADAMQVVFAGTGLLEDGEKRSYVLRLRASVHAEWGKAAQAFLAIGRWLLEAKDRLAAHEFRALTDHADRLLPFGRHVAHQLVTVAAKVDLPKRSHA
jgi:hypothetical protein